MSRLQYNPNPPPQTLTEQSAQDLATYLQAELEELSLFIGTITDTPDSPKPIGYGTVVNGVMTKSSHNIVSMVASTLSNYALFTVTTVDSLPSTSALITNVNGNGAAGATISCGATNRTAETTYAIAVLYTDLSTTTPTDLTFNFSTSELPA